LTVLVTLSASDRTASGGAGIVALILRIHVDSRSVRRTLGRSDRLALSYPVSGRELSTSTERRLGAMRRMRELAARAGFQDDRWTALTADASDAWIPIIRQEQEQDFDLIVIGKHGRSAMEDMLLGSTTNRVIGESSSDVLVSTRNDA
jgi:nucleotide-binding universal stress UspA family protein